MAPTLPLTWRKWRDPKQHRALAHALADDLATLCGQSVPVLTEAATVADTTCGRCIYLGAELVAKAQAT